MSETTTARAMLGRQERALQILLSGTTIPLKEGGGVVFPNGFPGVGYRLDNWQFDRYRAGLAKAMLGKAAEKRARLVCWILLLGILGLLLCFVARNFLEKAPYFGSSLDSQLPQAGVVFVVVAAIAGLILINNQAMEFASEFKQAQRMRRHAYLYQRLLGTLIAQDKRLLFLHISTLIPLALAAHLTRAAVTSSRPFVDFAVVMDFAVVVLPIALYATWRLGLLLTYWTFRSKHGRAPEQADVEPL